MHRCFCKGRCSPRSGQQGVNNPSFLLHLREISRTLELNLLESLCARPVPLWERSAQARLLGTPEATEAHLGWSSIVEAAVNKEEQVKTPEMLLCECELLLSRWRLDSGWVHRGARTASDAMDLKVRCLLLLFTFHVQEGDTGNSEADLGLNRLFQVFLP